MVASGPSSDPPAGYLQAVQSRAQHGHTTVLGAIQLRSRSLPGALALHDLEAEIARQGRQAARQPTPSWVVALMERVDGAQATKARPGVGQPVAADWVEDVVQRLPPLARS